jgi:hypothetical protein
MPGSTSVASSLSHEGSLGDTGNSKSRSIGSDDELTASDTDSTNRVKVAEAALIIFDFGASNASKAHI